MNKFITERRNFCVLNSIIAIIIIVNLSYINVRAFNEAYINNTINIKSKSIKESNMHLKADINIPVIEGIKNKDVEKQINFNLETKSIEFLKDVKLLQKEYKEQSEKYGEVAQTFEARSEFKIGYNQNNILSIPIIYYQYTGGAHGIYFQKTFNFDAELGKEIKIRDLFKEDFNYKKIMNDKIAETIAKNENSFFKDKFKGIDDNTDFYLSNGELVIYFQLYDIAPYAFGIPEFKIPYSQIEKGLKYKL